MFYILGSMHLMLCLSSLLHCTYLPVFIMLLHDQNYLIMLNHVYTHEGMSHFGGGTCHNVKWFASTQNSCTYRTFLHFSLFRLFLCIWVMFWFSNLTYFDHFALDITPLFSQYIQDACQSSIQTSSFYCS